MRVSRTFRPGVKRAGLPLAPDKAWRHESLWEAPEAQLHRLRRSGCIPGLADPGQHDGEVHQRVPQAPDHVAPPFITTAGSA